MTDVSVPDPSDAELTQPEPEEVALPEPPVADTDEVVATASEAVPESPAEAESPVAADPEPESGGAPEPEAASESETAAAPEAERETGTGAEAEPDTAAEAAPTVPTPAAAMPRKPRSGIRPAAPATPTVSPASAADALAAAAFGRVDIDGTVHVREGDTWRAVGQYPDGTPDEALAYFVRKYLELAGEVTLLEARQRGGGASAADLRTTAAAVRERVTGAAAVGDLPSLEARLSKLDKALSKASAEEVAAQRAAVDAAIAERTALVEKIEQIAARDPKSIQWKQTSADVAELFAQWQAHQASGPRLPKSIGQQLWKRFRDARSQIDKHRREFFSQLDDQHKSARDAKTRLVERAEALAPRGEDGIGDYRSLLDQWKAAGRAGKKVDDALWARFKAAGDVLYGARVQREQADAEASKEKIDAKRALLEEAAAVGKEKDNAKARQLLTGIQRRWDDIGRIFPRDAERGLDDQLRKIEQALKQREDAAWKSSNPETKARQNDMASQLHDAIAELEVELAAAEAAGDKRAAAEAAEALAARKSWLKVIGG